MEPRRTCLLVDKAGVQKEMGKEEETFSDIFMEVIFYWSESKIFFFSALLVGDSCDKDQQDTGLERSDNGTLFYCMSSVN